MPLRPLPFREVKHRLEAAGFTEVSSKGSHVKFAKFAGEDTWIVIVPHLKYRLEHCVVFYARPI
jgi:predicted RNA binding protein YcfA (HicA-like mRNA interferase family)